MESKVEATLPRFSSRICAGPTPAEVGFGYATSPGVIWDLSHQPPSEIDNSSFTALLELPPIQAVELLANECFPTKSPPPLCPPDVGLTDRASKFSVFVFGDSLPQKNSDFLGSSSMKLDAVKQEPLDSDSRLKSSSPAVSNRNPKSVKRKDTEKQVNDSNKKKKKAVANEISDGGGETQPYVHVRARRGEATDSHSLAERARREKINARMKLLQELVPGCSKISGTAMVFDEIINHVQALQCQVQFLSMRLAAVTPRSNFNLDALLNEEGEPAANDSYDSAFSQSIWPQVAESGSKQQISQEFWHEQPAWSREEDNLNFITLDNSLLSFHSSPNSGKSQVTE